MNIFFEDATIWVLASFIIFVGLAIALGRRTIVSMLDAKIASIRTEIANAAALRDEAQKLLLEYETKQKAAHSEAERMLSDARAQAEELHKRAEAELAETATRRETMLKERIQRMEEQAFADIRKYAADLAISATTEIIAQKLDQASANKLADASIQKISGNLN